MFNKVFEGKKPEKVELPDTKDSQELLAAKDEQLGVTDKSKQNSSQTTEIGPEKESFSEKMMGNVEALSKMAKSKKAIRAVEVLVVLTAMAASSAGCVTVRGISNDVHRETVRAKKYHQLIIENENTKKRALFDRGVSDALDIIRRGGSLGYIPGSGQYDRNFANEYSEGKLGTLRAYKDFLERAKRDAATFEGEEKAIEDFIRIYHSR